MNSPDISVRNLWKVFGPGGEKIPNNPELSGSEFRRAAGTHRLRAAVRDMNFNVAKGEVFVVMGLSGSGKSTLIRCLTRLIEPHVGQVLVDGKDVLQAGVPSCASCAAGRCPWCSSISAFFPTAPC